jgi:hypothetical protein
MLSVRKKVDKLSFLIGSLKFTKISYQSTGLGLEKFILAHEY